jgi:hypothetical protein
MKRKKMDLSKKLVLNKETIANLTPGQQAKVVGGASGHPEICVLTTDPTFGTVACPSPASAFCPYASQGTDCGIQAP